MGPTEMMILKEYISWVIVRWFFQGCGGFLSNYEG